MDYSSRYPALMLLSYHRDNSADIADFGDVIYL